MADYIEWAHCLYVVAHAFALQWTSVSMPPVFGLVLDVAAYFFFRSECCSEQSSEKLMDLDRHTSLPTTYNITVYTMRI